MKPNRFTLLPPAPKLTAFCGQEYENGPATMLVIKGFSSETAVAGFCLKLAALGIVTVSPVDELARDVLAEKLQ